MYENPNPTESNRIGPEEERKSIQKSEEEYVDWRSGQYQLSRSELDQLPNQPEPDRIADRTKPNRTKPNRMEGRSEVKQENGDWA